MQTINNNSLVYCNVYENIIRQDKIFFNIFCSKKGKKGKSIYEKRNIILIQTSS